MSSTTARITAKLLILSLTAMQKRTTLRVRAASEVFFDNPGARKLQELSAAQNPEIRRVLDVCAVWNTGILQVHSQRIRYFFHTLPTFGKSQ